MQVGQPVTFRVNGYAGKQFAGTIERINPQANEQTRQVQVFVKLNEQYNFVAGLYSEGYITVAQQQALMLPPGALVQEGDNSYVWLLKDNKLVKTAVTTGNKDPRYGTIEVTAGVSVNDEILRHPQGQLKDGLKIERQSDRAVAAVGTKQATEPATEPAVKPGK